MLDYPLPRITRLLAAIGRYEDEQARRLLNVIAVAARGGLEDIQELGATLEDSDHAV